MKNNSNFTENFDPYEVDKIGKISTTIKVFVLKAWMASALFYFIYMSSLIFFAVKDHLDRYLITALFIMLAYEFFVLLVIKLMDREDAPMNKHVMFKKSKWSLFLTIPYIGGVFVLTIIIGTSIFINNGISLSKLFMPNEIATWEPIMFGLLFYALDTLFVSIKNLIVKFSHRNKKAGEQNNEV